MKKSKTKIHAAGKFGKLDFTVTESKDFRKKKQIEMSIYDSRDGSYVAGFSLSEYRHKEFLPEFVSFIKAITGFDAIPANDRADKKIIYDRILQGSWRSTQGGDVCYQGNGKWSGGLVVPLSGSEEANALCRLVGYVPIKIQSKGDCKNCIFSRNGHERGYEQPCGGCLRPLMSNFKAKPKKKK